MPFKAPEAPKCPKCERSVYAAEEKVAGGFKWHKVCFKCNMCNKMLDSTTCAEHERQLFCKTCYGRKYGPKGVGFGGGAGALSMDTGARFANDASVSNPGENGMTQSSEAPTRSKIIPAPEGDGCPRCGGFVYHADQVFSRLRAWHKGCFKCTICHRALDSRLACDGPDKDVYCTGCYRKRYGLQGYGFGQGGPVLLSGGEPNGRDHINSSHSNFMTNLVDTTSIPAKSVESGCPRCGGQVFHAEQMFARGKIYHKKCFSCGRCRRPLDSVLCCDAPDGDIYCKACYAKIFGTKGYGFGCGAGFLMCEDGDNGGGGNNQNDNDDECVRGRTVTNVSTTSIPGDGGKDTCPRCGGQVFHAEQILSKTHVFHRNCFTCLECKRPLDSTLCCDALPEGEVFCKVCYAKIFGPKGYGYGGSGSVPALISSSTASDGGQGQPFATEESRIQSRMAAENAFMLP